jgi:hypothetical protein
LDQEVVRVGLRCHMACEHSLQDVGL